MNVITITPPLVQLNSPYPSGAYLNSFFKMMGLNSKWFDFNISFFYSIFSREGLEKLFLLSEKKALKKADAAEKNGDNGTAFNLRRYVQTKQNWIEWIDYIVKILCGTAREKEHQFLFSPSAPRGSRCENFLASLNHEPSVDDVRFLASYALADIADYINVAFDPNFSLIRYAESLAVNDYDFAQIEKAVESPLLNDFYKPVLEYYFSDSSKAFLADMVCISIPFAGTFYPALYTAKYLKQKFGDKVFVCVGGGFVNTELRDFNESKFRNYADAICYDRGYGSYLRLLKDFSKTKQIYKLRQFGKNVIEPLWQDEEAGQFEAEMTTKVFPDYSDIDLSIYPRLCDDVNAMHRLWTDGCWLKAYLAHGCYWHKCAFCDTSLDYVCSYKPVDTEGLFNALYKTACEKNTFGIHFVDEALPLKPLKKFALLNARNGNRLFYWGNIRFEKSFTKDAAAFLSYCGFGGVSGGIEVATGDGLKNINKGTDIQSIVSSAAAFKEAGILVHAYMIYGFWNDTAQSIINSMETLRQLFAAGLLDSAFWHKFVLTRNSTAYSQWKAGIIKDLIPIENKQKGVFAGNSIHFKGEEKYSKFTDGLELALNAWMHQKGLEKKVNKWFNFQTPPPQVKSDFIELLIQNYEDSNAQRKITEKSELFWLGGNLVESGSKLFWTYLQEEYSLKTSSFDSYGAGFNSTKIKSILEAIKPSSDEKTYNENLEQIKKSPELLKILRGFFDKGLVVL